MKRDETRGKSVLNPINYKGDVLVQVWMDSRVLATMSNYLDILGDYPKHMSQVVRRPLELFCALLVDEGEVEMVDETTLARFLLERRYHVNLNKGNKGRKNKLHNQILSDSRNRLGMNIAKKVSEGHKTDAATPLTGKSRYRDGGEIDKLTKLYHTLNGGDIPSHHDEEVDRQIEESKANDRARDLQAAKDMGLIVDVPVVVNESKVEPIVDEKPTNTFIPKQRDHERYKGMTDEDFHRTLAEEDEPYLKELNKPVEELKFDIVDK